MRCSIFIASRMSEAVAGGDRLSGVRPAPAAPCPASARRTCGWSHAPPVRWRRPRVSGVEHDRPRRRSRRERRRPMRATWATCGASPSICELDRRRVEQRASTACASPSTLTVKRPGASRWIADHEVAGAAAVADLHQRSRRPSRHAPSVCQGDGARVRGPRPPAAAGASAVCRAAAIAASSRCAPLRRANRAGARRGSGCASRPARTPDARGRRTGRRCWS